MAKTKKETKENLKEMKTSELEEKTASLRESLRLLRFKAQGSKSKNVKESRTIRKQIAVVLTEINRRQLKVIK